MKNIRWQITSNPLIRSSLLQSIAQLRWLQGRGRHSCHSCCQATALIRLFDRTPIPVEDFLQAMHLYTKTWCWLWSLFLLISTLHCCQGTLPHCHTATLHCCQGTPLIRLSSWKPFQEDLSANFATLQLIRFITKVLHKLGLCKVLHLKGFLPVPCKCFWSSQKSALYLPCTSLVPPLYPARATGPRATQRWGKWVAGRWSTDESHSTFR